MATVSAAFTESHLHAAEGLEPDNFAQPSVNLQYSCFALHTCLQSWLGACDSGLAHELCIYCHVYIYTVISKLWTSLEANLSMWSVSFQSQKAVFS